MVLVLKVKDIFYNNSDHHGCPFKHFSGESLKSHLLSYRFKSVGLTTPQVNEILQLTQNHHYQLACTKLYELTRQTKEPVETVVNPSQFYQYSVQTDNVDKPQ
jgi:DNA primase large subunit